MEVEEGYAIPLILHQDREGFKMTQEGLDLLNSITKKIGVISVAGKYRTGKSYLLNKIILNIKSKGFGVGPSINPCTKGIWIYNKPINFRTSDGEDIALLIIDSEGLGAFDQETNHDTKIFMLSVLLSSFFIYNSIGSIDENALNNLSLIVNLTKNLQIRSMDSELDVDEVANYFPTFLWILRDFSLQLLDSSGRVITSKEYLENSLMNQRGMSDAIEAKNRIRKLLKHFFKDRDCFALVRPSETEETLTNLQNVSENELRPEFVRQIGQLRKNIMRKVKVKSLNGKPLTGVMLAGMAQSYIDAINKGAVPTIEGAWQSVVTAECSKQIEAATSEYDKKIKSRISKQPLGAKELKALHKEIKNEAKNMFKDKAVGDDINPYLEALKKKINDRFNLLKTQNDRKLGEKCDEECKEIVFEFQDKLKSGEYSDLQVFKREFEKRAAALKKTMPEGEVTDTKIKEMSSAILTEAAEYISRSQLLEQKNSNRRLQEQVEIYKSTLESKKEEYFKEKDYFKQKVQDLESENFKLKALSASLEMRLDELRDEKERLNSSHQERLDTLKDDFKDRFSEYKEKYEIILKNYQELQEKYNNDINRLQKELALCRQEVEFKDKELRELKIRRETFEIEYKELRSQLRRAKEEVEDQAEIIKKLKNSIPAEPSAEWLNERSILKNQIEGLRAQVEENKSVKEALVSALQSRSYEPPVETKDPTKPLTVALEKTEERCQELEQKVERLKKFQKIFNYSANIQCKMCGKSFTSPLFHAHISICEQNFARNSELGEYIVVVTQIQTRDEGTDQKQSTDYFISVTYKGRTWSISKVFKNFKALEASLQKELPEAEIPDSSLLYPRETGSIFNNRNQLNGEERKKRFQEYLNHLVSNHQIKSSESLRKFLNTDQYFPEEENRRVMTRRLGKS
jgi:hypothetical protein